MIVASMTARITKDTPGALEWSHEVAGFVKKKTGNEVEVLVRIGATQDIVWLQRFQDLAEFEKVQTQVQSDPEYQARLKTAQDREYFDSANVEAGIWRQF